MLRRAQWWKQRSHVTILAAYFAGIPQNPVLRLIDVCYINLSITVLYLLRVRVYAVKKQYQTDTMMYIPHFFCYPKDIFFTFWKIFIYNSVTSCLLVFTHLTVHRCVCVHKLINYLYIVLPPLPCAVHILNFRKNISKRKKGKASSRTFFSKISQCVWSWYAHISHR